MESLAISLVGITLLTLVAILAIAEILARVREARQEMQALETLMQRDIVSLRDAIQSVARKSTERIATVEGRLSADAPSSVSGHADVAKRRATDWTTDSDFSGNALPRESNPSNVAR